MFTVFNAFNLTVTFLDYASAGICLYGFKYMCIGCKKKGSERQKREVRDKVVIPHQQPNTEDGVKHYQHSKLTPYLTAPSCVLSLSIRHDNEIICRGFQIAVKSQLRLRRWQRDFSESPEVRDFQTQVNGNWILGCGLLRHLIKLC